MPINPPSIKQRTLNLGSASAGSRLGSGRRWFLAVLACLGGSVLFLSQEAAAATLDLAANAQVDSSGVYLSEIVKADQPLPALRLCDAPAVGKAIDLSRSQINTLLAGVAPSLTTVSWSGANDVNISRRTRTLTEMDALNLLTSTLQRDYVKDKGELELDFTQPWEAPTVPDEPLSVNLLELPVAGVAPNFIIRFELRTRTEIIGSWQSSMRAHVWRMVWAAHSNLQRGQLLADADIDQERRDVLTVHESLAQFSPYDTSQEFATGVQAGNILLARDLKPRTVMHRGQMADALLQDGALNIMMKVEVMEDGAPGQVIQVRNPVSMRSLTGKVVNDQTIAISL